MMFGKGHDYKGRKISPLQVTILVLLRKRPMYGYEVLKELRDRFEGVWTPQTGSIYPSLKRLEEHGLIGSEKREGTDYYHITSEGEGWVIERLSHSPRRDFQMLIRYLDIISKASAEVRAEAPSCPGRFEDDFVDDDSDASRREKKLKIARERIAAHLAEIDKELRELELANNKEGSK